MSDWNNFKPRERITNWKDFRESMQGKSADLQIKAVAEHFSTMPVGARTIDYYTPDTWLTPWEILYHGYFCKNTVSLMMFYTLKIVREDLPIELYLIDDKEDIYLVPVVNNEFALNYEYRKISRWHTLKKHVKVVEKFDLSDVKVY